MSASLRWFSTARIVLLGGIPDKCLNYQFQCRRQEIADGSPPRVWGIHLHGDRLQGDGRFTPTRVGNTEREPLTWAARPVHPHACGEYSSRRFSVISIAGSPPRVWGIHGDAAHKGCRQRFTPTRVGNTARRRSSAVHVPVHPHACGEYAPSPLTAPTVSGSPPRVWGNRLAVSPRCQHGVDEAYSPSVWRVRMTERSDRHSASHQAAPCGQG